MNGYLTRYGKNLEALKFQAMDEKLFKNSKKSA